MKLLKQTNEQKKKGCVYIYYVSSQIKEKVINKYINHFSIIPVYVFFFVLFFIVAQTYIVCFFFGLLSFFVEVNK